MTIVIADDNRANRRVLQALLDSAGYPWVEADNGRDALTLLFQQKGPVVGLIDWEMPGLDGPDVCRAVRARGDGPPVYLILLTVRNEHADVVAGLQAGANDYVTKPFHGPELLARVKIGAQMAELQDALAGRIRELQNALANIKQLSGLLPMCSYCKKVRNDQDYWQQVEEYVSAHSDARFSHGYCPECLENRVKPEMERLRLRMAAGPSSP